MPNSYVIFKPDSEQPRYLGTFQSIEECNDATKDYGFLCMVLVLNKDHKTIKDAFDTVAEVVDILDYSWITLLSRGDII